MDVHLWDTRNSKQCLAIDETEDQVAGSCPILAPMRWISVQSAPRLYFHFATDVVGLSSTREVRPSACVLILGLVHPSPLRCASTECRMTVSWLNWDRCQNLYPSPLRCASTKCRMTNRNWTKTCVGVCIRALCGWLEALSRDVS